MRLLTYFTTFALVGLLAAAPTSNDDDDNKITVTKNSYIKEFVRYQAEHDVVKLLVPLNALNNNESESSSSSFSSSESNEMDSGVVLFFVEADVQPDGSHVDQGLYVFREGKAKKILHYGRDAAASADDSNQAFFGARNGLYVYNFETNSADKYGLITDSIIAIEKETTGDVIYILTEDREVYKVTDNGEKKEKLDDVVNAKDIVLDYENNLYFYSDDKKPYVRTADGIKKIEGLPESTGNVILFKPPFMNESGAPVIVNNYVYVMYPNGTSEYSKFGFKPDAMPTALAPGGSLIQYFAFDKKIYAYNMLDLILSSVLEELTDFFKTLQPTINEIASKETSPPSCTNDF